ncbi:hypothetical protein PPERSA_10829 [Pseudocohnilembus persalinus]|uniref:Uncharacterized protein n=1 Tax=Pseudocohnilembus persalinus TaxID=266149 RepID=A0A0V0QDQ0_PSEPJ|nr:hypothetical protein PPERSA_10829 [Pseudocohnilembus persalinus]|eukprot:KRX00330.1 hypothetical protein PPERSA_10829 [Pseudocohnilembus persalinus]
MQGNSNKQEQKQGNLGEQINVLQQQQEKQNTQANQNEIQKNDVQNNIQNQVENQQNQEKMQDENQVNENEEFEEEEEYEGQLDCQDEKVQIKFDTQLPQVLQKDKNFKNLQQGRMMGLGQNNNCILSDYYNYGFNWETFWAYKNKIGYVKCKEQGKTFMQNQAKQVLKDGIPLECGGFEGAIYQETEDMAQQYQYQYTNQYMKQNPPELATRYDIIKAPFQCDYGLDQKQIQDDSEALKEQVLKPYQDSNQKNDLNELFNYIYFQQNQNEAIINRIKINEVYRQKYKKNLDTNSQQAQPSKQSTVFPLENKQQVESSKNALFQLDLNIIRQQNQQIQQQNQQSGTQSINNNNNNNQLGIKNNLTNLQQNVKSTTGNKIDTENKDQSEKSRKNNKKQKSVSSRSQSNSSVSVSNDSSKSSQSQSASRERSLSKEKSQGKKKQKKRKKRVSQSGSRSFSSSGSMSIESRKKSRSRSQRASKGRKHRNKKDKKEKKVRVEKENKKKKYKGDSRSRSRSVKEKDRMKESKRSKKQSKKRYSRTKSRSKSPLLRGESSYSRKRDQQQQLQQQQQRRKRRNSYFSSNSRERSYSRESRGRYSRRSYKREQNKSNNNNEKELGRSISQNRIQTSQSIDKHKPRQLEIKKEVRYYDDDTEFTLDDLTKGGSKSKGPPIYEEFVLKSRERERDYDRDKNREREYDKTEQLSQERRKGSGLYKGGRSTKSPSYQKNKGNDQQKDIQRVTQKDFVGLYKSKRGISGNNYEENNNNNNNHKNESNNEDGGNQNQNHKKTNGEARAQQMKEMELQLQQQESDSKQKNDFGQNMELPALIAKTSSQKGGKGNKFMQNINGILQNNQKKKKLQL